MSKLEACPQTHHAGYPLKHAPDLFSVFNIKSHVSSKFQFLCPMDSCISYPSPSSSKCGAWSFLMLRTISVCLLWQWGRYPPTKSKTKSYLHLSRAQTFAVGGMPDMAVGNIHLETKIIFMSTKYALHKAYGTKTWYYRSIQSTLGIYRPSKHYCKRKLRRAYQL